MNILLASIVAILFLLGIWLAAVSLTLIIEQLFNITK
jgi:hypothetical protein